MLRPFQRQALQALDQDRHVIGIASTGAGKTRIVIEYARQRAVRILYFSPLVALSRQLQRRFLEAGLLATLEPPQPRAPVGVWILSPESLQFPRSLERVRAWRPELVVVDECHCIEAWGSGFRPAFAALPEIVECLKPSRSLWLSASLSVEARARLLTRLPTQARVIDDFQIPANLRLSLPRVPLPDRIPALYRWLANHPEPGLLFAGTRSNTERLTRLLLDFGRPALCYHAGLSREERLGLECHLRDSPSVIVATSAFGMGMDYAHLRWTLFWQAPHSLLELLQGFGRAGRNPHEPADAASFWEPADFHALEWIARRAPGKREEIEQTLNYFRTAQCRTWGLNQAFSSRPRLVPCGNCDVCEAQLAQVRAPALRSFP